MSNEEENIDDHVERLAIDIDEEAETANARKIDADHVAVVDNEKEELEADQSEPDIALPSGRDSLLLQFPTRQHWTTRFEDLVRDWNKDLTVWIAAAPELSAMLLTIEEDMVIRNCLLLKDYPGIPEYLVDNHAEWCDFIERGAMAQQELPRAVNWLKLMKKEYEGLDGVYGRVFTLLENNAPREGYAMQIALLQLDYHLERYRFIRDGLDESALRMEALEEDEPEWLYWDDFCEDDVVQEEVMKSSRGVQ